MRNHKLAEWIAGLRAHLTRLAGVVASWRRELNGDAAYARYLTHWHDHPHAGECAPLDRAAFFAAETTRRWDGVRRCC